MILILFTIFSILFLITSIMPFVKKESWWIRGFDFPHVQFTVFGLGCIILAIASFSHFTCFHYTLTALIIIGVIVKLYIIYPYTFLHSIVVPKATSTKSINSISILTSNVFMENENYNGFIELVKETNPDIIFMLETNHAWMENIKSFMDDRYEHQILHPLENTYGLLFYSKLPLEKEEVRFLVEDDVPSIISDLCFDDGSTLKFIGLHPKPPSPTENAESTPRDAELIIAGREARSCVSPVIIAGDMNDVAWSHTTRLFARISGLLDLRIGRGFFNTFHAKYPLLRWPLDHIFVSHHFKLVSMKRLKNFNSDHYPIYAHLALETSNEAAGNIEHPDMEDLKEAKKKVKESS